ncbi:MAG TPA: DUF6677 family protein [Clostridia bacterium]|nr:DUF6677 family protein [Clostridia bacterium]
MANANGTKTAPETPAATPMALGALALGWLIPGAGHLLLRRWGRGLLLLAAICTMFFFGLQMQGKVYAFNTGDLLDILGFFGDIGAGLLYFLARGMNWGEGAVHRAVADYGTKYIIVAGLLNIISAIDAYHIGIGKKQ